MYEQDSNNGTLLQSWHTQLLNYTVPATQKMYLTFYNEILY